MTGLKWTARGWGFVVGLVLISDYPEAGLMLALGTIVGAVLGAAYIVLDDEP